MVLEILNIKPKYFKIFWKCKIVLEILNINEEREKLNPKLIK